MAYGLRCSYFGVFKDGSGKIVPSGSVTVYLAGTSTLASIYTTVSGTTAVNSTTSSSVNGSFEFWIDRFDYDESTKFKIVLSKSGYTSQTIDNVNIDSVVLGTYTISADLTVTTDIYVPSGVLFSVASGKTLTLNGIVEAGPYQIFTGDGTVTVGTATILRWGEWWGTSTTGIGTQWQSLTSGGSTAQNTWQWPLKFIDVRAYTSINAAITAIGSTQATLVVPNAQTITANLVIPSTLTLKIPQGGSIVHTHPFTLTINGPFEAGLYQVFSGFAAGDVTFDSVKEIYPEWWGAVGDGSTDDSTALQSVFTLVQGTASTFKPKVRFLAKQYNYSTALTLANGIGASFEGNAGYYTPQPAGYVGIGTTLYYTGSGAALLISGSSTGIIIEKIYFKGTSSAINGVYVNGAGIVFKYCTFGQFSKVGGGGLIGDSSQLVTCYNCSFIGNYYGSYLTNGPDTNTTWSFYSCLWWGNTLAGHYEARAQRTLLSHPTFQGGSNIGGSAVIINVSPVGAEDSQGFMWIGGYVSGVNDGAAGWEVDVIGHATAEPYYGLILRDIFWASPGALSTGQIRLQKTIKAVHDNIRYAAAPPIIAAISTGANINKDLIFYNWNASHAATCITDGAATTEYWPRTMVDTDNYGYKIVGNTVIIHQTDPASTREALQIQQDAPAKAFIDYVGTDEAGNTKSISTWKTGATLAGYKRIEINNTVYWEPFYTAPTAP